MGKPEKINKELVLKQAKTIKKQSIRFQDCIIYALGLGYSKDPMNEKELEYTYERHENFKIFPSFAVIMGQKTDDIFETLANNPGIPEFNPMMLLHGELRLELFAELNIDSEYELEYSIVDVQDKKSGAVFIAKTEIYELEDKKRKLQARMFNSLFVRGLGGFESKNVVNFGQTTLPKDQKPDHMVECKTDPNQAIIYRLAADVNPLHIDPNMAAMGGFKKPILHGVCFQGLVMKSFITHVAKNRQDVVRGTNVRFTGHVFPGETLEIAFWKQNGVYVFAAQTKERKKQVIMGEILLKQDAKL